MLKLKTHIWFFITAVVILLSGIIHHFFSEDTVFDLNIHDTYYVIPHIYLAVAFTLLYLLAGCIYWTLRNFKLVRILTLVHTIISVGGVILFWTLLPTLRATDTIFVRRAETAEWILYGLVLFTQQLFIINIVIGLTKGRKNQELI